MSTAPASPEDREYGLAASFAEVFALSTVVELARRAVTPQPLVAFAVGLAMVLAVGLFGLHLTLPLPSSVDDVVVGSVVGLWARRAVGVHLGMLLAVWVQAVALATFARQVRDPDATALDALADADLAKRALGYGLAVQVVESVVALPWVAFVLWRVVSGDAAFGVIGPAAGLALRALVWAVFQPGLWALSIDGVPVRFALVQSVGAALRYPHVLGPLFGVLFAGVALGCGLLFAPALFLLGAFHAGVAAAWVLFGATAPEARELPLYEGLVD